MSNTMTRFTTYLMAMLTLSGLLGCNKAPEMTGTWEIEFVDAYDCGLELELEQYGDELEGEADFHCVTFPVIDDQEYEYEMSYRGVEVEGEFEDGEFELELTIRDDLWGTWDLVLEGELDIDELEGDVEVNGEDLGEFEGELD
jgi:hypothetical protein